jgi:hypothetical protein
MALSLHTISFHPPTQALNCAKTGILRLYEFSVGHANVESLGLLLIADGQEM